MLSVMRVCVHVLGVTGECVHVLSVMGECVHVLFVMGACVHMLSVTGECMYVLIEGMHVSIHDQLTPQVRSPRIQETDHGPDCVGSFSWVRDY